MEVLLPRTLQEALEMRAANPGAVPIAGGTDVMVELNFDLLRPETAIDVSRIPELREWRVEDGAFFLGASVTYSRIMRELPQFTPLVQASRTVGSPQIRNRGTVGGNLGTGSPAGDALPVLAAYDADVLVASASRTRSLPWNDFHVGVKRTVLEPDELIVGARWRPTRGPGSFSKIGTRNAMVIAVANLCLVVDEDRRAIRVAVGSVAPTILRASEAESFASDAMTEAGAWEEPTAPLSREALAEFGERVAAVARPIDDVRGTAAYRRRACAVLARRALGWALEAPGGGAG